MVKNWIQVASCAIVGGSLGLVLYWSQAGLVEPLMNPWGVISFASLGAGMGCLLCESSHAS